MKIFFTASLSGKEKYLDNYKKIVETLEKEGSEVIASHVLEKNRQEVEKESLSERQDYQKQFHKWINRADLVVAEISYPSTGVGYQLTHALEKGKPVLSLHVEEKTPVAFIGRPSEKLILASYSLDRLEKILPRLIKEAKDQMDVRFNFFISPQISAYLDWIAKHKKTPRAVFLRNLIKNHMKKNKEYRQK